MSLRKLAVVVSVACASALAAPVAASAATPTHATSTNNIPVTGTTHSGKKFNGRYTIDRFVTKQGKTYALGTVSGRLGHRFVRESNVAMPVAVKQTPTGFAHTAITCSILHLDLGPLTLNLLGLNVHLNEVVLDITATTGPGNLLGNLLCSVANLLNGQSSILGQQLTGLLNIIQTLLNTPGLLNLNGL